MNHTPQDFREEIRQVAVFGNGVMAWTTAAVLASQFKQFEITLVICPGEDHLQPIESSWPSIFQIHQWLNIAENQLLSRTHSGFSLGTQYRQWPKLNSTDSNTRSDISDFFAPFSHFGFNLKGIDFLTHLVRARRQQLNVSVNLDDYSLSAQAARQMKFRPPGQNNTSVFSTLKYAYNLNTERYQKLLQAKAQEFGVKVVYAEKFQIHTGTTSAGIESVDIVEQWDGRNTKITADLFVDCSDHNRILVNARDDCDEEHTEEQLQFRYTATKSSATEPYSTLTARKLGWSYHAESSGLLSGVYVVHKSGQETVDAVKQQVSDELSASLEGALEHLEPVKVSLGSRKSWVANCLAMGGAGTAHEPMFIPKLHLFHRSLISLVESFPANRQGMATCASHYNRLQQREGSFVNEFNLLHQWSLKDLFVDQQNRQLPETLQQRLEYRLALFQSRGKHGFFEGDLIDSHIWIAFLLNNGLWPVHCDPMAEAVNPIWVTQQLNKIHRTFKQAVTAMPVHDHYIAGIFQGKTHDIL